MTMEREWVWLTKVASIGNGPVEVILVWGVGSIERCGVQGTYWDRKTDRQAGRCRGVDSCRTDRCSQIDKHTNRQTDTAQEDGQRGAYRHVCSIQDPGPGSHLYSFFPSDSAARAMDVFTACSALIWARKGSRRALSTHLRGSVTFFFLSFCKTCF